MFLRTGVNLYLFAALASGRDPQGFRKTVQPFLARHCLACHNEKVKTAQMSLAFPSHQAAVQALVWEEVLAKVRSGEMPPPGRPRPKAAELNGVTAWVESLLQAPGRAVKPDPGRVTARRLNRTEYNYTIRDLLAVDFRPADDFPADDSGYGFDNIGDVLSISPVLMEKYMNAAERIARLAVAPSRPMKPTVERYAVDPLGAAVFEARHRFPTDAEYEIRAGLGGNRKGAEPLKLALSLDGQELRLFEVDSNPERPRSFELRLPVRAGDKRVKIALLNRPADPNPADRQRNVVLDHIEVRGPYQAAQAGPPESYRRVFVCGTQDAACARRIVAELARRAWRRPVTEREADGLARFVAVAQQQGDSFEAGVRVALQAILVSPHFLFRIERDRHPGPHPVNEFELAARLSYFLWSSMPDDELLRLAEAGVLRKPEVLRLQVRRMLADSRIERLVENFGGQWLQLRNLESVKPDPERFPEFDEELRAAMYNETRLFFESLIREDRGVLDFLTAPYTFLNARLAKHYGMAGVDGPQFRLVEVPAGQRSGVLTHASILTISSYPTRTSPVIRGKWVLENILGAPPPPPPPDVPELDEKKIGTAGSLRQQLEEHRANPACAVCHNKMDAIGFGLENFDAIGRWRTHDGAFAIDPSGTLPGGKVFQGPAELMGVLKSTPDDFARALAEKMLTYALGRGLERADRPAVEGMIHALARDDYRFSTLVWEIVNSMPFQMRRGEATTGGKAK